MDTLREATKPLWRLEIKEKLSENQNFMFNRQSIFVLLSLIFSSGWSSAHDARPQANPLLTVPPLTYAAPLQEAIDLSARQGERLDPIFIEQLARSYEVQVSLFELADVILKNFPPSEFDYVSLGRSGAALSLAMELRLEQERSTARVLEFPLSGLHDRDHYFRPESYERSFALHFKNFFSGFRSEVRKVLVLDAISHGDTIKAFASILAMAERKGWVQHEVHLLGMLNGSIGEDFVRKLVTEADGDRGLPIERWHAFRIPTALFPFFCFSTFDVFARFEGWYFRDAGFDAESLIYHSVRSHESREQGAPSKEPLEPAYHQPRDKENPGVFRRLLRMGGHSERQRLKESMQKTLLKESALKSPSCQTLLTLTNS